MTDTITGDATERARRDWRYAHERAGYDGPVGPHAVDILTSDLPLAMARMKNCLDGLGRRGHAGAWMENETLLAMRFVLESLGDALGEPYLTLLARPIYRP